MTLGIKRFVLTGVNKNICYYLTKPIDLIFQDRLIDKDDLDLLMSGLTHSMEEPTGKLKYSDWLNENKETIGIKWNSSLQRHYDIYENKWWIFI